MRKLIGISGKKKAGKDTAALPLLRKGFKRLAFADPLKRGVEEMFGWSAYETDTQEGKAKVDPMWNVTPREVMEKLGTDIFRDQLTQIFPELKLSERSFWIQRMKSSLQNIKYRQSDVVIPDVRFPDEVDFIHKMGGKVIRIIPEYTGYEIDSNESDLEKALDDYHDFDIIISNDGSISDLEKLIQQLVLKGV